MKSTILIISFLATFAIGFAFNSYLQDKPADAPMQRRATGIGGVFFKCKEPKKVREWYKTHLGLITNPYGAVFEWRQALDSSKKGFTQWSPFRDSSHYFDPSTKDFMINYRVENLGSLIDDLKKEGVTVTDTIQSVEYGKFVHIMDLEGNKIELWEPNDVEFEKLGVQIGAQTTK